MVFSNVLFSCSCEDTKKVLIAGYTLAAKADGMNSSAKVSLCAVTYHPTYCFPANARIMYLSVYVKTLTSIAAKANGTAILRNTVIIRGSQVGNGKKCTFFLMTHNENTKLKKLPMSVAVKSPCSPYPF